MNVNNSKNLLENIQKVVALKKRVTDTLRRILGCTDLSGTTAFILLTVCAIASMNISDKT